MADAPFLFWKLSDIKAAQHLFRAHERLFERRGRLEHLQATRNDVGQRRLAHPHGNLELVGQITVEAGKQTAAAREQNTMGISSADLARNIPGSVYCSTLDKVTAQLRELARPGDLILTVGAGDIYRAGEKLLKESEN